MNSQTFSDESMCTVGPNSGTVSPIHKPLLLCAFQRKYWKCLLISVFMYICLATSMSCWFQTIKLNDALQYINLVRHAAPIIWWRVVCYHFVRRSRQIIRYRNGVASTTTQVYYERTNSHVDEKEFDYSNCGVRDVSNELSNLGKHSLVVIDFTKCFSFSNLAGENQYLGQRCDFFRANETWDNYLEAKEGMKLRNVEWKDHLLVCEDPNRPPWYATHHLYWIFSVFLGSWFFRVFLEHKAAMVTYQVEKLFGDVSAPRQTNDSTWTPLNRVATMDSTDLEWQIQTNQLCVPSYNEATRHSNSVPQDLRNPTTTLNEGENGHLQPASSNKYSSATSSIPTRPVLRSRSWLRDERQRSLVTSVRRSVSQFFGRPTIESDDDDVNLLSNSPHERESQAGRPLSEAPPTYSEAMDLHRILGFYDLSNRHRSAEMDVVGPENAEQQETPESRTRNSTSNQRQPMQRRFYRRKRPNQLRVRSQYIPDIASTTMRFSLLSREATTGPAAIQCVRQSYSSTQALSSREIAGQSTESAGGASPPQNLQHTEGESHSVAVLHDSAAGDGGVRENLENAGSVSSGTSYGTIRREYLSRT